MDTIRSAIERGTFLLSEAGIESPRLNCEILLSHVRGCRRSALQGASEEKLTPESKALFESLLNRRLSQEPLQYICGETEFMGLRFFIDPRALIPRPETELLVEEVISSFSLREPLRFLDVGTGSGNVAVSLAKFLPECTVDAIDISADALDLATKNIRHHGVQDRVRTLNADIFKKSDGHYDAIVSNPPYVSTAEYNLLPREIREFEPGIATTDRADGLTFHRRIAELGLRILRPGGRVFLENAYDQNADVEKIFHEAGYADIRSVKDFGGILRVLKALRPPAA